MIKCKDCKYLITGRLASDDVLGLCMKRDQLILSDKSGCNIDVKEKD